MITSLDRWDSQVGCSFNTGSITTFQIRRSAQAPSYSCNVSQCSLHHVCQRFSRFSASWTTLTAGAYSILFIHPTWSKHPLSSVGTQAIWVFVTLVLWIIGTGLLNGAVPSLLVRGQCYGIVYCGHIQSLFGEQP